MLIDIVFAFLIDLCLHVQTEKFIKMKDFMEDMKSPYMLDLINL